VPFGFDFFVITFDSEADSAFLAFVFFRASLTGFFLLNPGLDLPRVFTFFGPSEDHFLRSLQALNKAKEEVDIQMVKGTARSERN